MFKVDVNKTEKPQFNINKLIIKLNKQALTDNVISPKELIFTEQEIQPVAEQSAEPMFEIY